MIQQTGRLQSPIRREDLESRKKRLLDRAAVERAQFAQARTELGAKFASLNTFRQWLLRWPVRPASWLGGSLERHPILGILFSILWATPARTVLLNRVKRAKSLIYWSVSALRFGKGCIYCARPKRTVQDKHSLFTFLPSIAQLYQRYASPSTGLNVARLHPAHNCRIHH